MKRSSMTAAEWLEFVGLTTGPHLFSEMVASYLCFRGFPDLLDSHKRFWDSAGTVLDLTDIAVLPIAAFAANQRSFTSLCCLAVLITLIQLVMVTVIGLMFLSGTCLGALCTLVGLLGTKTLYEEGECAQGQLKPPASAVILIVLECNEDAGS